MGSIGTRFGRNVPLDDSFREPSGALLEPNPRVVSRELLTRERFLPATTLNVLAAAWIQFEVHDWFSHGRTSRAPWELPLADDDDWPERPMAIPRARRDPTSDPERRTFVTADSHWWDGSQIYGSDERFASRPRGRREVSRGACPRGTSRRSPTSAVWPGTSGSGWGSSTRCSRSSTTPSATVCAASSPPGPTITSTPRRA